MTPKTIAMIFPGQGSQAVGMGRALFESSPAARAIFQRADAALGRALSALCFDGPEEELRQTFNTQPALYTVSAAALAILEEAGIAPTWVAGHSLGEYSALYAARVFDFETGLKLVALRGQAMHDAGRARPGAMAALLSLEPEQVRTICAEASAKGYVAPANFNSPGQIVISGEPDAVAEAVRLAQSSGSRRSQMLPVSGAFHSPLVQPAVEPMEEALIATTMHPPQCHFVANVSANEVMEVALIRDGLAQQIVSCVRWSESVETMVHGGANLFIEVGAGKVLTGLLKRIVPQEPGAANVTGINFGAPEDLEKVQALLAAG